MEKKYILALTKEPVDLSAFPEARVGPPGSPPPPSIGQVVLPRLARRLCEEFPEFEVLPGCNKEDFESKIEMTQKAEVLVLLDAPPALLEAVVPLCPRLQWVHSCLAGVEGLCGALQRLHAQVTTGQTTGPPRMQQQLLVTNARGVFSSALKEYALAAMLHFAKQIPRLQQQQQTCCWAPFVMAELRGSTVGFVGYGDIAKQIAGACKFLGMRCIALRRDATKKCELLEAVYEAGSKDELEVYRQSDFVVCTLPATAATCCCITKAHFAAMKKTAVFISLGRGQVLDEEALLQALRSGSIGGAALDVFQQEPLAAAAAVWSCPNLLLSPHNADWLENYSSSSSTRVFLENLKCFLRGPRGPQDMSTPVDCSRGY
ncbi:Glyoxylate reductase/hydroxypyruvate reductase-like, related [Eimeria tenella]|uniref:Glyoxylate reductase/hydroxypyruvate reductase-like, related n=1 Tax=Eimeria tenella TaxID=5802 RepID=U6KLP5_EIMTE|nr:Glyoxylate reductase/hydroxypyruvate reductase-like, related [Eimeria tenella]CDJ37217.1 Glyoxylate reductase/hydroxypyruvate reductase-like, related [Eimeria tenella]|eukprot:XP_013228055.1 Glyoxylate reductase/hydroxypyruvate reductase-like, related [Eimeria tenella]